MRKEIKTKRKVLPMGYPYSVVDIFFSIFELIRGVRKPSIVLNLSLNSHPQLYSVADDNILEINPTLNLSIKARTKEIGNIALDAIINFYVNEERHTQKLDFTKPPAVIEQDEEIILQSTTPLSAAMVNTKTSLKLVSTYDFMIKDKINTQQVVSTWGFIIENNALSTNLLKRLT